MPLPASMGTSPLHTKWPPMSARFRNSSANLSANFVRNDPFARRQAWDHAAAGLRPVKLQAIHASSTKSVAKAGR
jgi:hypothetical protein